MAVTGRVTPDEVEDLPTGQVFVFGSNQSGRHGKGAAKTALRWGAKWGQASGHQGRTYGIPTKNYSVTRTLALDEIRRHVDDFVAFAASRPDLTFLVTEIGCGLAGLHPDAMFARKQAIEKQFDGDIVWERLDGKNASRIKHELSYTDLPLEHRGFYDKVSWTAWIKWYADSMIKFHAAVLPVWQQVSE